MIFSFIFLPFNGRYPVRIIVPIIARRGRFGLRIVVNVGVGERGVESGINGNGTPLCTAAAIVHIFQTCAITESAAANLRYARRYDNAYKGGAILISLRVKLLMVLITQVTIANTMTIPIMINGILLSSFVFWVFYVFARTKLFRRPFLLVGVPKALNSRQRQPSWKFRRQLPAAFTPCAARLEFLRKARSFCRVFSSNRRHRR